MPKPRGHRGRVPTQCGDINFDARECNSRVTRSKHKARNLVVEEPPLDLG